ncbi:MAG: hypothetical protein IH975_11035 [Nitrospinae bacterium]|nr:hypothetical protein [Nitrospinota bacterium]
MLSFTWFFFAVVLNLLAQSPALEKPNISLSGSGPISWAGSTTQITLSITNGKRALTDVLVTASFDEQPVGSKALERIEADAQKDLIFDILIPQTAYLGMHYVKTHIQFHFEGDRKRQERYKTLDIEVQRYWPHLISRPWVVLLILFGVSILVPLLGEKSDLITWILPKNMQLIDWEFRKLIVHSIMAGFGSFVAVTGFSLNEVLKKTPLLLFWSIFMACLMGLTAFYVFSVYRLQAGEQPHKSSRYAFYSVIAFFCMVIWWLFPLIF